MSYQKRKLKRKLSSWLKFKVGPAWNWLKRKKALLKRNVKINERRNEPMRLKQTREVMEMLRRRSSLIRVNNPRIDEWVDNYLTDCMLNGQKANVLTQWCLSKALEKRFKEQGRQFIPLKGERRVIQEEIPNLVALFKGNGFGINWLVTFNRSPVDTGLLQPEIESAYKRMIADLAKDQCYQENVLFLDWEDDFLGGRAKPDQEVLQNYFNYVAKSAFELRLEQLTKWSREEAGLEKTRDELERDIILEAACEAEEARRLSGEDSPFGRENFLIFPVEVAERYDNFSIFVPNFKKRVVSVLTPYPWRLKN